MTNLYMTNKITNANINYKKKRCQLLMAKNIDKLYI